MHIRPHLLGFLVFASVFQVGCSDQEPLSRLSCEVAIVGGGAGGLHTAMRLSETLGGKVCLFEKNDQLGGRIYDVSLEPGGAKMGVGARRIMEGQDIVFALADELGIQYEEAPWQGDLISARGKFAVSSDDVTDAYPRLVPEGCKEKDLYDKIRSEEQRVKAQNFPDFRSYLRNITGEQGYHFLLDISRFRADFEYPIDARGYLDYLDEEWDVCCKPSYPIGGMSEFIRKMHARAVANGARVFTSEPVEKISSQTTGGPYIVETERYRVDAQKVVIAADAQGLAHITGNIAEAIQSQAQFKDLVGVRVVTITQWWPEAWWLKTNARGANIKRAWTTEHCLNHIEIPVDKYGVDQVVTRSVYDDDMRCVAFWENTAKISMDHVEAEIARGLKYLFPDVEIPKPLRTYMHVWPNAWYWLKGGSRFTNKDIFDWAVEPLAGEEVSLVSESYHPQRSGWSDAAYKSSINALQARFGIKPKEAPIKNRHERASQRRSMSQGGH